MAFYADTSALVKLVLDEAGTVALHGWVSAANHAVVSCDLTRTELVRAVRQTFPDRAIHARAVLDAIVLLRVTAAVFDEAARLEPVGLRSLDALHLAAALSLGDDLEGLLTYDERLAEAATRHGVTVVAPR
ncbi:type II toxin-antitoxin system VapC family toxin [Spongisporangium articulatum]|uniref:Ribonuclease VapC n=1 Tax=Spongisporangium articulatum TaxID=3362603 RepID=A0ABW8AQN9_9ACTN